MKHQCFLLIWNRFGFGFSNYYQTILIKLENNSSFITFLDNLVLLCIEVSNFKLQPFESLCIESKKVKFKKHFSESKAFHSALVNAVEAVKYIHKKTKKPHYQLHPDQTCIGMHYAHHRSLLERVRVRARARATCGSVCRDSCCKARALNSSRMVCLESSSM